MPVFNTIQVTDFTLPYLDGQSSASLRGGFLLEIGSCFTKPVSMSKMATTGGRIRTSSLPGEAKVKMTPLVLQCIKPGYLHFGSHMVAYIANRTSKLF